MSATVTLRVDESLLDHVRSEVERERIQTSFDRMQAREYVKGTVALCRAGDLRVGDYFVATDGGRTFYRHARITSSAPAAPDQRHDLWIKFDHHEGGRGGSAFADDDVVLMERGS